MLLIRQLALAMACLVAASRAAEGAITKSCLNSDAASQERLLMYDALVVRGASVPSGEIPAEGQSVSVRSNANDRTARTPYEFSRDILLDWDKWPSVRLKFGDSVHEFLGVHINDKNETEPAPCIRLMFRTFAPTYKDVAGFGYLRDEYETAKPRQISLKAAIEVMQGNVVAAHDARTETFYVIDLTRLRSSAFWKQRYEIYRSNVNSASDPKAFPVHFERLLFNIIRLSRYLPDVMSMDERAGLLRATIEAFRQRGIDCGSQPPPAACTLNRILMETELGPAHPLMVTDALDNSGLAFGPRQLDLGQGRADATAFAQQYLLEESEKAEKWSARFLRPIEQMPLGDLRQLYSRVVPTFNERLGTYGDQVVSLYVTGILQMASDDYKVKLLSAVGRAAELAQLLAADFSNKWSKARAIEVITGMKSGGPYAECAVLSSWRDQMKKSGFPPGDVADFRRRAQHIAAYFSQVFPGSANNCSI